MRFRDAARVLGAAALGSVAAAGLTAAESSMLRSLHVGGRVVAWTIRGHGRSVVLRQGRFPVGASLGLSRCLEMDLGVQGGGEALHEGRSASMSGPAGGWLSTRWQPAPEWLVGVGGSVPLRDRSLSTDEARTIAWLEETGLQMPEAGLALGSLLELRIGRELRLGDRLRAGVAASAAHRGSYHVREGEATLDPGERFSLGVEVDGAAHALSWSGNVQAIRDLFALVDGMKRYREGDRIRLGLSVLHPGRFEWEAGLSSYLQARGAGSDGWAAPSGGTIGRGDLEVRAGGAWQGSAGLSVWRTTGFDDRLGEVWVVRPSVGIGRGLRAHTIALRIAPSLGDGANGRSLRGWDAALTWDFRP